ncbi:MAG: hypothetical protein IT192_07720 [Microbacteriaceae bacterium]|nr:hypothetical protein [Microbacteriaceae bacterium]
MVEAGREESGFVGRLIEAWTPLIGSEYATRLSKVRRNMLIFLPLFVVGLFGGVLTQFVPSSNISVKMVTAILAFLLLSTPFLLSAVDLIRLMLRIQRDLEAAGFTVKPGGPDLRNIESFKSWSKRSGITSEDIIGVGNSILGEVK